MDMETVDLESGVNHYNRKEEEEEPLHQRRRPSVREQSRRFSRLLISQSELSRLLTRRSSNNNNSAATFDTTRANEDAFENEYNNDETDGIVRGGDDHQGGCRYCWNEAQQARDHGGDYVSRLDRASRAALGTLLVFGSLIWTQQHAFKGAWIGNVFMLVNLHDSWGAALRSSISFAAGLVVTTIAAMPLSALLRLALTPTQAKWALPVVVSGASFATMSCPHLASRNIMLLVLYILITSAVRRQDDDDNDHYVWWEPLSWTATYFVGLAAAIVVHIVPQPWQSSWSSSCWRPNSATQKVHELLQTLELDLAMLLRQSRQYADHSANLVPTQARSAIASIELLYQRIADHVQLLKAQVPAAQTELQWTGRPEAATDLMDWTTHLDKTIISLPLKSLVTALSHRVLGEDQHVTSASLRRAKSILAEQSAPSRDRLLDAMVTTISICGAKADPLDRRVVLPDVQDELKEALAEHKIQFNQAIQHAARSLHQQTSDPEGNSTNNMAFAHLTRRKTALCAICDLCESLLDFLSRHHWETSSSASYQQQNNDNGHAPETFAMDSKRGLLLSWWNSLISTPWLWHDPDQFRLALKTAVGMFLGSLFVSVEYLWNLSEPFGLWVGISIASVNLSTTGSSFAKASDRLYGTLLAAAYAMLVTFPATQQNDYVLVLAITLFTWILFFVKTQEHAYRYVYAAASIGSMLYGSLQNHMDVATEYIPLRIELIFTGICIFTLVEILLFHRSSTRMVEQDALAFFPTMRDFCKQATVCAQRMQTYCDLRPQPQPQQHRGDNGTTLALVLGSHSTANDSNEDNNSEDEDPFQLKKLEECHVALQSLGKKLQAELPSALEEPRMGFSLDLDARSYRGLLDAVQDCDLQASLVIRSLRKLSLLYRPPHNSSLRYTLWPKRHAEFLGHVFRVAEVASHKLSEAYPDGRLRPQSGNALRAALAAASLREFHDVRLVMVSQWSQLFGKAMEEQQQQQSNNNSSGVDPVSIMNTSITTTRILDLCRHLQTAGKHAEAIAHNFPAAAKRA